MRNLQSLTLCLVCVVGLWHFVPLAAAADDKKAGEPLAHLLAYAEAVVLQQERVGNRHVIGPAVFFQHPYAQPSLSRRIMNIMQNPHLENSDIENVFLDEIRDAKLVENVLQKVGEGKERLSALAEIHPFTICSREELDVLAEILREMVRVGCSCDQVVCLSKFINELQPLFVMNPHFPSINSKVLELERACFLARNKKLDSARAKDFLQILENDPFNYELVYSVACLFSLTDQIEEAKKLLARVALMDKGILETAKQDPDMENVRKDKDWFENFVSGKIRPTVEPASDPGIAKVTVEYHWGGMGKQVNETRTLIWQNDRYIEQTSKIEMPAQLVQKLLEHLSNAQLSTSLQQLITHYDDYPVVKVTLERKDGNKIMLLSNSNTPAMLPINIADKTLKVTNELFVGRLLQFMLNWLEIERGVPMASFQFGGTQISEGTVGRRLSAEEIEFCKEAGLLDQLSSQKPEPLPSEFTALAARVSHNGATYVTDRNGNRAVNLDYYNLSSKEDKVTFNLNLVHVTNADRNIWYPEQPSALYSRALDLSNALQKISGESLKECTIQARIHSVDYTGFPDTSDLMEILTLALQFDLEFAAFGRPPVLTQVAFDGNDFYLKGWLMLGSGTIYSNDVEIKMLKPDSRLAAALIDWSGIRKELYRDIGALKLRNNTLYIDFVASATNDDIEVMKKDITAAGRTIEEKKRAGYGLQIKESADKILYTIIEPPDNIAVRIKSK